MAFTERLAMLVTANVDQAVQGLRKVEREADRSLGRAESRADRWAQGFTKAGAMMLTTGGLMAAGLWKAGEAASDLNETVNQSEQIFGSAAGSVGEFAEAATAIGQSERAAREAANTFGLFFTNAGKADDEAADMSITMANLASDMASFKNTSPEEAVEALGAALRGESEPIRRYGVMLDEATLKQRALDMGLIETTTGTLPPAIKMQAAYAEILAQTTTIQGDFARTAEDPANAMRVMRAEFENTTAALGEAMLPIMKDGIGVINDLLGAFTSLPGPVQSTISKLAVATTGVLLVGGAVASAVGQVIKMREQFGPAARKAADFARSMRSVDGAIRVGSFTAAAAGLLILTDRLQDNANAASRYAQEIAGGFSDPERQLANVRAELEELQHVAGRGVRLDAGPVSLFSSNEAREAEDRIDALTSLAADLELQMSLTADAELEAAEGAAAVGSSTDVAGQYIEDFEEATAEAEDAQRALSDAMDGVIDAAFRGLDATADWEAGLDDLRDAVKENGASLDLTTEAGRRNHSIMTGLVEAGRARIQSMIDEGRSADEVRHAQELMSLELSNTATQLGINRWEAALYTNTLNAIPTSVVSTVTIRANLAQFLADLDRANGMVYSRIGGGPQFRAAGGPVTAGDPYIVGEKGPELFVPGASGQIIPNHQAGSMVGGGGGGSTTIILQVGEHELGRVTLDSLNALSRVNGPLPLKIA